MDQRPGLFQAVRAALRPGGYFLFEAYNQQQLTRGTGGPALASHLVTLAEMIDHFEGFEMMVARDQIRDIQEGAHHRGLSSVTQLIARKPPAI